MSISINNLYSLSIQIERNTARLYSIFAGALPPDRPFWTQLSEEEIQHATMLRTAKEHLRPAGVITDDIVGHNIEELQASNDRLVHLCEEFSARPPTREQAFDTAQEIERAAGEIHLHRYMESTEEFDIFRKLNGLDLRHKELIGARAQTVRRSKKPW